MLTKSRYMLGSYADRSAAVRICPGAGRNQNIRHFRSNLRIEHDPTPSNYGHVFEEVRRITVINIININCI